MLEEIAANDRGDHATKHFAAIQAQLRPNPPLGLLSWCPREVLELERWRDPDRSYGEKPPSGERGHIKRLLACLILLRNGAYVKGAFGLSEEDFFLQTSAASLIRLTGSALVLKAPKLALGFMLWLFELHRHSALRPFTAFCAFTLAASIGFGEMSEPNIIQICNWVDAIERRSRKTLGDEVDTERWLIGLNSYERSPTDRDLWLLVARQAFDEAHRDYSAETRAVLQRFVDRLAES